MTKKKARLKKEILDKPKHCFDLFCCFDSKEIKRYAIHECQSRDLTESLTQHCGKCFHMIYFPLITHCRY